MEAACLIVGLGNPGAEYAATRHNAGFLLLDTLAQRDRLTWKRERQWSALLSKTERSDWLLKPLTFMNLSGDCVQPVAQFYKIPAERILVVYDDLALPLGKLRLRNSGSAGGHNGMRSIIGRLKTDQFPRLRIGIGQGPHGTMVDHVLGRFQPEEETLLNEVLQRGSDAVECILREGMETAMNRFNTNNPKQSEEKQQQ